MLNPFKDYPLTVLPFSLILYAYCHWDFRVIFALLVIVSPLWIFFLLVFSFGCFCFCIYIKYKWMDEWVNETVCVCVCCNILQRPNVSEWKYNRKKSAPNHCIQIAYSIASTPGREKKVSGIYWRIGKKNNEYIIGVQAKLKQINWPRVYHFSA